MRNFGNHGIGWMIGTGIVTGAAFALLLSAPAPTQAASAAKGNETFQAKCAMCHGKNGRADTPMGKSMKIVDLRSKATQKKTDAEIAGIISNGKSPMPGYASQLSKADIDDVVAFIREMAKKK